jgi:hypothetical protein
MATSRARAAATRRPNQASHPATRRRRQGERLLEQAHPLDRLVSLKTLFVLALALKIWTNILADLDQALTIATGKASFMSWHEPNARERMEIMK